MMKRWRKTVSIFLCVFVCLSLIPIRTAAETEQALTAKVTETIELPPEAEDSLSAATENIMSLTEQQDSPSADPDSDEEGTEKLALSDETLTSGEASVSDGQTNDEIKEPDDSAALENPVIPEYTDDSTADLSCANDDCDDVEMTENDSEEDLLISSEKEESEWNEDLIQEEMVLLADAAEEKKSVTEMKLNVAYHSTQDIASFLNQHPMFLTQDYWEEDPSFEEPYNPGILQRKTQQNSVNLINQIRYIAGLNADVVFDSQMGEYAQAAAFLNYLNGKSSHYPERPSVLSDSKYNTMVEAGKKGAKSSNLGGTNKNLPYYIINSWMDDSDSSNIDRIGHRRWILNPKMGKTALGRVGKYVSLYATDETGNGNQTNVAWPAQNTPVEYFTIRSAWNLSIGTAVEKDKTSVTLTRKTDGKVWRFREGQADGDFYVDNVNYGLPGCIIFRPSGLDLISAGDSFDVDINTSLSDGGKAHIAYTVNFFSVHMHDAYLTNTKKATCLENGYSGDLFCYSCGASIKGEATPVLAHNYVNGYCTYCGSFIRFEDVTDPSAYYYEPVYWAAVNGITSGTSQTTFSPNKSCTRGQIVTFLWKSMGSPEPSLTNNPFTDVKPSDYFYKPVLWAKEKGITSGKTATSFAPGSPCTRGQIVTFLWIAKGRPEPSSLNNPFNDVKTSDYFFKAVLWAKENGITSGTSATAFSPGKTCTRAQAVTFLYKAFN